jgi:hypothetical protein
MPKERKSDLVIIILFQIIFWGGLIVACFAKEIGLPNWAPRTILIVYGAVFVLYVVGCLIYGGISLGLQWSDSLFQQHGSRFKVLLLLPGYALLAALAWLAFALASQHVPESGALPLIALLLAPGVMIGVVYALIRGHRK